MKVKKRTYFLISILVMFCILAPVCYYQNKLDAYETKIQQQKGKISLLEDYYSDALADKNRFEGLYDSVQEDNKYLIAQLEELQKWRTLGQFTITYYWPRRRSIRSFNFYRCYCWRRKNHSGRSYNHTIWFDYKNQWKWISCGRLRWSD